MPFPADGFALPLQRFDTRKAFKELETTLPKPGVYCYYDADVPAVCGQSETPAQRVSSYFQKSDHAARIKLLVRKIDRIEFTITNSERMHLLENTLIKQYQPKYNVNLGTERPIRI